MDVSEARAQSLALRTKANYFTTEIDKVLNDDSVKLVYIIVTMPATLSMPLSSLKPENMFISKSLTLNEDQLERLTRHSGQLLKFEWI